MSRRCSRKIINKVVTFKTMKSTAVNFWTTLINSYIRIKTLSLSVYHIRLILTQSLNPHLRMIFHTSTEMFLDSSDVQVFQRYTPYKNHGNWMMLIRPIQKASSLISRRRSSLDPEFQMANILNLLDEIWWQNPFQEPELYWQAPCSPATLMTLTVWTLHIWQASSSKWSSQRAVD